MRLHSSRALRSSADDASTRRPTALSNRGGCHRDGGVRRFGACSHIRAPDGRGYYIAVGAADLVASGDITLVSGVEVTKLTEDSVVLSNGDELKADLVVYATGYGSMNGLAADLIS